MSIDSHSTLTLPVGPRDHSRGSDVARVTLLEYGDYECPQCARAHPIVKHLQDVFGADLRFVFRNFPLTNAHPHAQRAAEAAEWAASQGKFWPLHDALYDQATKLSEPRILGLAEGLGLDRASLDQAWRAHTFFARVKEDFASGLATGVKGTPTFFINGVRYEGINDTAGMTRALQQATDAGPGDAQRSG